MSVQQVAKFILRDSEIKQAARMYSLLFADSLYSF